MVKTMLGFSSGLWEESSRGADEGGDVEELVAGGIGGGRGGVGCEDVDLQWTQKEVSTSGQA